MQYIEKKIKLIRDKLGRIGIGKKCLDNETLIASYSLGTIGHLCSIDKISGNPSGSH